MLSQTFKSSAPPAERPILAPAWQIVLLAALVGGGLVLLYPRQALERRLAALEDGTDVALSAAYLVNLLRSDPNNTRLRLLLAHQQTTLGELPQARNTLRPLAQSTDPNVQRNLLWAQWEIIHAQYLRTPEEKEEQRATLREEVKRQLRNLAAQDWPVDRQVQLGSWAAQYEDRVTTAQTHRELAEQESDPERASQLYERAAREALAISDYDACAELYLHARRTTSDPERSKAYFHAAVDALQSANRPGDALALAEREIGPLIDDPATLVRIINLARAAARPDVADRYVRKLLRIALALPAEPLGVLAEQSSNSALRPVAWQPPPSEAPPATYDDGAHWLRPPAPSFPGWRTVATAQPARSSITPGIPFDEKTFSLAYQVFLENNKPDDAWAIARVAVQQRPDDMVWRERLAHVSEWTQRPEVALEHWLVLAQRTDREQAWQAVLRIAPGLFDDRALVQAIKHNLRNAQRSGKSTSKLTQELIEAYERMGEPQAAMDYLQTHGQGVEAREQLAYLAERMGDPKTALVYWREVLAFPDALTHERAMHAAVVALTLRRPDEGLVWLEAASKLSTKPTEAQDFWRMTGQLAQGRQRQTLAIDAYRKLIHLEDSESEDYEALAQLLLQDHPLEAAQVHELAWRRFQDPGDLVDALTFHVSRSRWADAARLLREADAPPGSKPTAAQKALFKLPEFMRLAGSYHQNTGNLAKARGYFEAGLRVAPDSADMRSALLWLFIDSNDAVAVRLLLATHEATWSLDTAMHDSLAAAYQALSLPQTALDRYLTPRFAGHENDFLWLMNYADALDQNQQTDRSWRLRRHLLAQQWKQVQAGLDPRLPTTAEQARKNWLNEAGIDQARRIARARLVLTQKPGDPALHVLRELLRLDRDAEINFTNAAAETAIGWLQDAGEYTAERGFLWHQYARSQGLRANRPLWADITVALAEKDTAATGQLLETFDERLPRYDRVNAARAVDDVRLAQTAAFEGLEHQNDDQPLHLQLTESLMAFSDHGRATATQRRLSGINERELQETVHIAINPRVSLDLGHTRILRESTNTQTIVQPPNEKAVHARLAWRHPDGETLLMAAQRKSFDTYTSAELEHEQRIDNRLSLRMSLGINLPSQESLALRVAGMKDKASVSVRYQATRQDSITATLWGERYQLQTGGALGSGRHHMLYYTHSYRQDSPRLDFNIFWSGHNFRRADLSLLSERDEGYRRLLPPESEGPGPDYFLPDSFRYYGVQIATNMLYEQEYTRKLQPYAAISRTWHSRFGAGYGLRLGLAGSVLGADHFSVNWNYERSGLRSEGPSHEMQVSYRLHF